MQNNVIQLRPNASDGLWLSFILPLAIAFSVIKHNAESSEIYQYCFLLSFGILCTTILFVYKYKNKNIFLANKYFVYMGVIVSLMYLADSRGGVMFCSYGGILSSIGFYKIFQFILKKLPLCFTIGEALFCAQGTTIFIYSSTISLYNAFNIVPRTSMQIATIIIQVGLLSIAFICCISCKFNYFHIGKNFYALSMVTIMFMLLLPLHLILRQSPLMWIFHQFTKDTTTIAMLLYWLICSGWAAYAVSKQIKGARKASTVIRKTFHILAVLVFLPGLLYECSIIYLASGVTLGIFILLELLRNLNIPPLGAALEDGFSVFSDEKDVGAIALTPMYLLVGCSLPLWIHPAPCDLTNSAGFNLLPLLGGLLSIGIGDTFASYIGTKIGKHKWSGTDKTIEGTLGCILSQLLAVYLLFNLGFINLHHQGDIVKVIIGVVTVALVEAKTTQVDNLVLPLLMYIILL